MRRVVLCEGPEDITAIREIAILLFDARFLHQNDTCRPHVREAIQEVSLFRDLSQALGFSAAATE